MGDVLGIAIKKQDEEYLELLTKGGDMETVFDKANSFVEEVKAVLVKYEVSVKEQEEQHHETTFTFIVSKDGVSVELSIDDLLY